MSRAGLDALVCSLPMNVLMLTGYWPVTGRSVAIVHRLGGSALAVPEDEWDLARRASVDQVVTFQPVEEAQGKLRLTPVREATAGAVRFLPRVDTVGYEEGACFVPAPYVALLVYGPSCLELTSAIWPDATIVPAGDMLTRSRAVLTRKEMERVRAACRLASIAFADGSRQLRPGLPEPMAAHAFRKALADLDEAPRATRADGFTYCMSGSNAERAAAAFQSSTRRRIERGEPVLVHCNSFVDGYWTDVTRTYCLGSPSARLRAAFTAVMAARTAALEEIREGVRAAVVDLAVRRTLTQHGFGEHVRHGCGHGVGFSAIDHDAPPVMRADSEDTLAAGMVLNVEPGVYGPDIGGIRHCDMVAVTRGGYELLTPFQSAMDELLRPEYGSIGEFARSE